MFCVYLAKIFGINKMSMKNKKKQLNSISQIHLKSKRLARIEEILEEIVKKIDGQGNEAILVVLKYNKKYLNFVEKKISIKTEIM